MGRRTARRSGSVAGTGRGGAVSPVATRRLGAT